MAGPRAPKHTRMHRCGLWVRQKINQGVRQMLPLNPPVLLPLVRHSCSHLEIKERGQSTGERLTASFYRLQVDAALPDRTERRTAGPRRPTWWLDYEPRYLWTCGKADGEDFFLNNNVGVGITVSSLTLTPGFLVKGSLIIQVWINSHIERVNTGLRKSLQGLLVLLTWTTVKGIFQQPVGRFR